MSSLKDRLDAESSDDRLAAAEAKLPRRMQCKFQDADGTVCQKRRVGRSWCDTHKEIVFNRNMSARDRKLVARLPPVAAS
jgi:hypothetical protein